MARIETDPNYSSPTFSRATEGTDLFRKEDVQALAAAVSTHDHTTGKGAVLVAGSIPAGAITSGMIADATIVAGDIADGAVTSAKILDGTIATGDLADASVTNAKLASDTARANLLTNGSFEIWQRGPGPFTTTGLFTADRWQLLLSGTDMASVSRAANTTNLSSAFLLGAFFTLGTGAGNSSITHTLRPSDQLESVRGQTITLSMRAYSAVASALRIGINVTGGSAVVSTPHTGGGSWETLTASVAVPLSATSVYLNVYFAASGTFYVDNAMLVVGSVAADYAPLHPADDLARCQRYYERVEQTGLAICIAQCIGPADIIGVITYRTTKAVTPTVTTSVPSTFVITNSAGSGAACTVMSPHGSSLSTLQFGASCAGGLTAGNAAQLQAAGGQTGSFLSEANP